jgi:hypothetical protein
LIDWWHRGDRRAAPPMREDMKQLALRTKGFLPEADGLRLYELAYRAAGRGPCVEVGSYCGRSALFIGAGCRARGAHALFSIDHHGGSEEQQLDQEYFDPDLYDARRGRVDTLPAFIATIAAAGLADWVFPIVGASSAVAASWPRATLALVFVDGGHSKPAVDADAAGWGRLVARGGWLCFHDVFPDPADGGQAPYEAFERVRAGGDWSFEGLFGSLGVLRRR